MSRPDDSDSDVSESDEGDRCRNCGNSKHYHYTQRDTPRNPVIAQASEKYEAPVECVTLSYLFMCDEDREDEAREKLKKASMLVDKVFEKYKNTVEMRNPKPKITPYSPQTGGASSETVIRYRGTYSFEARYRFKRPTESTPNFPELYAPTQKDFQEVIRFNRDMTSGDLNKVRLTDKRYEFDENLRTAYTLALTLATSKARQRAEMMAGAADGALILPAFRIEELNRPAFESQQRLERAAYDDAPQAVYSKRTVSSSPSYAVESNDAFLMLPTPKEVSATVQVTFETRRFGKQATKPSFFAEHTETK